MSNMACVHCVTSAYYHSIIRYIVVTSDNSLAVHTGMVDVFL